MIDFGIIEGIVYDLDGTIIDTKLLHEEGWKYAGKLFGVDITSQMLIDQKGRSGKDAARLMLPSERHNEVDNFRDAKAQYVMQHLGDIVITSGFIETYNALNEMGLRPWVCTSSSIDFIEGVLRAVQELQEILRGNIVYKGMYTKSKPDPEPLLVTLQKMGVKLPQRAVYVGDAYSDYLCAENAETEFVYLCSGDRDARIPVDVPRIRDHRELLDLLK